MQKTAILFLILLSLVVIQAYAQEPASEAPVSISDKAEAFMTPSAFDSSAHKSLSLRFETFSAANQVGSADGNRIVSSSSSTGLIPSLGYGYLTAIKTLAQFRTTYGLELCEAIASQSLRQVSESGQVTTGKLQANLISLRPLMRVHWRSKNRIFTRIAGELGYAQADLFGATGSSSFSRTSGFVGYSVGVELDPSERFGVFADYYSRQGTSANQNAWSPTSSSYNIGLQYFL